MLENTENKPTIVPHSRFLVSHQVRVRPNFLPRQLLAL